MAWCPKIVRTGRRVEPRAKYAAADVKSGAPPGNDGKKSHLVKNEHSAEYAV